MQYGIRSTCSSCCGSNNERTCSTCYGTNESTRSSFVLREWQYNMGFVVLVVVAVVAPMKGLAVLVVAIFQIAI